MKFKLNTAPYEANISEIYITDEEKEKPLMLVKLKTVDLAKQYSKTLKMCLKMNDASMLDGYNKPSDAFNFVVFFASGEDCIKIQGNIVKALDLMSSRKLILKSTNEKMIFGDEDSSFLAFLEKNRAFSFNHNIDSALTSGQVTKIGTPESGNRLFSEPNTPRSSDVSSWNEINQKESKRA